MPSNGLLLEAPHVLDPLRGIEATIPEIGRAELANALGPLIGRLHEALGDKEREELCAFAIEFSRRLYSNARSGDALPLARAMLFQAFVSNDLPLERRASTVCGLLAADVGDVVEAVEHYVNALRLAGEDALEASGVWNNMGIAMRIAGNYEMAGRCYQRAIDLLRNCATPVFTRYAACVNLAQSHFQVSAFAEGLRFAERALAEQTEVFLDRDPHVALVLERNFVRLLVALGRLPEAEPHVSHATALANRIRTPRASIAAAITRSVYELATGQTDVSLTRLESALTTAREVPAALRDTLGSMISAEEAAGNSERALMRMTELSDHVYREAIERARSHIELAGLYTAVPSSAERLHEQARARLISKRAPAGQPESWEALQRLAVSAVMRTDNTGWHGKRVGAFSKALAMASGLDPLQSLEIGLAAELHDIGMVSVPEELAAKKGPLSEREEAIVMRHVDAGAEILRDDRHPRIFLAREIVRYHHARWDGCGYPARVGGKFIPLAARICAIADAYDELVSGLASRVVRTMDEALAALRREAGSRFDPELVARFEVMVRTESEELGVDLASTSGMEGFQELVNALQEDRGFV
jgi:putative two-component system response regulator